MNMKDQYEKLVADLEDLRYKLKILGRYEEAESLMRSVSAVKEAMTKGETYDTSSYLSFQQAQLAKR
jgi:hypothetical protein